MRPYARQSHPAGSFRLICTNCRHCQNLLNEIYCSIYRAKPESVEFVLTPMPRLEIETIQDFKILYEIGTLTPDMSVELSRILLGNASKPQNQFNMRSKNENSGMNQNTGQESKKRKGFGNDDSDAQKRVARPCWPSMNRIQIEDSWKMWPINTIVFTPSFRAFLSIHKKRADSFQRIRQMPLAQHGSMIVHIDLLFAHTHPKHIQMPRSSAYGLQGFHRAQLQLLSMAKNSYGSLGCLRIIACMPCLTALQAW